MSETALRDALVAHGRSLYERGYAHGRTGNLSVRLSDGVLITPTGSCLGRLEARRLSKIAADGTHLAGDAPSKEALLHLAMYAARPAAAAIVHLHCTCAVAIACLDHPDHADVLPALTPYQIMRVGTLPLVPYFRPGDPALADAVGREARTHRAVLLANHGPVTSGRDLDDAVDSAEELEATARLALQLNGRTVRTLTAAQIDALAQAFPS